MKKIKISGKKLVIKKGDITEEDTEAIVNAANSSLMGGGGVDGAIHSKGGPVILEECKKIRETEYPEGLPTGKAVITSGGNLKARYVIHTVGPVCSSGKLTEDKARLLKDAYYNSLRLASERGIKTIAFPSISTGAYRCPVEESSKIALKTAIDFLKEDRTVQEVRFVLFTDYIYEIYKKSLEELVK
ncbi:MAG TPA: O-acetyl-ADP-ribose deacetylase [Persephonella sp.]|nr:MULTISPECIES: O-acetyl-ADP-ribose deacetylase [Persephonella]HCB69161.1 O-acetyl-ADP-ribose deacetylase [Persephonella sp.]